MVVPLEVLLPLSAGAVTGAIGAVVVTVDPASVGAVAGVVGAVTGVTGALLVEVVAGADEVDVPCPLTVSVAGAVEAGAVAADVLVVVVVSLAGDEPELDPVETFATGVEVEVEVLFTEELGLLVATEPTEGDTGAVTGVTGVTEVVVVAIGTVGISTPAGVPPTTTPLTTFAVCDVAGAAGVVFSTTGTGFVTTVAVGVVVVASAWALVHGPDCLSQLPFLMTTQKMAPVAWSVISSPLETATVPASTRVT